MAEPEVIPQDGREKRKPSLQVPDPGSRRSSKASLASCLDLEGGSKGGSSESLQSFDNDRTRSARALMALKDLDVVEYESGDEYCSEVSEEYETIEVTEKNGIKKRSIDVVTEEEIVDCREEEEEQEEEKVEKLEEFDVLKEMDEDKILELEEAFELFDINGDGLITQADLKKTFVSLGQDVSDEEIRNMLDDGSKPLDLDAFLKMVGSRTIHLDPENVMADALSKWDKDNSGLISLSRISHDLMTAGDRFSPMEVEVALMYAPVVTVKGREMLEYHEFCQQLCSIRKKSKGGINAN